MRLTDDHYKFLERYKISTEDVFDATGMGAGEYKSHMKGTDYMVAWNSNSKDCNYGHQLKLRDTYGHCAECQVKKFPIVKDNKQGFVYAAYSKKAHLFKVGITVKESLEHRAYRICNSTYAGYDDWIMIKGIPSSKPRHAEALVHAKLKQYAHNINYLHHGIPVLATEIFKCTIEDIDNAFTGV